ncbi:MAG: Holliday junction branch migration protein RuvA, partial [Chitinophagaceae bacterium]
LDRCKLHTYLLVKEDAHTLFGFFEESEKQIFLQLISVSGIGATIARMMLSSLQPEEIRRAILQENESLLERIKGIGAKSAKRIILELKDKMLKQKDNLQISSLSNNTMENDALNALITLGVSRNAAELAVGKVIKEENKVQDVEQLIKLALKNL